MIKGLYAWLLLASAALAQPGCNPSGPNPCGQLNLTSGTTYTGLVATRGEIPFQTNSGSTWSLTRSYHIARQAMAANTMKVVWPNYYINGSNVETGVGAATYQYAVEYPAGTIRPCTINGVTTATISALADAVSGACNPAIPNGAGFWIRALRVGAGGIIYMQGAGGHYSITNEGFQFGSGTPTNNVNSGTITNDGVGFISYQPTAIIAPTTYPSVCLVGDSRMYGQIDVISDATEDTGQVVRAVGQAFAYTKIAVPSTNAVQATTNFTNRLRLIAYCSHVISGYGINDAAGGTSAATIATARTTLAGLWPTAITFGTTLTTETTSTDSWATTTNQTGTGNPSIVATFNTLERAGISGESNVLDVANIVDPLGLGKWPVSKIPGATTGTANFATTDGIHETPLMDQIIGLGLGYVQSWIYRR